MTEPNHTEMKRILTLVEEGKITAQEGDRLVASLEARQESLRCPYCAEEIAIGLDQCPECSSSLRDPSRGMGVASPPAGDGLRGLNGLGKFLVLYTFAVTAMVILTGFRAFAQPATFFRVGLAGLGLLSAILICKDNPTGWTLGAMWGALQIPVVIAHHAALNKQVFSADFTWLINGSGLGINLVGIILLVLFIKARPEGPPRYRPPEARSYNPGGIP